MGAGLAQGNYDVTGLCDLYFCNKEGAEPALFQQLGNWKFEELRRKRACLHEPVFLPPARSSRT